MSSGENHRDITVPKCGGASHMVGSTLVGSPMADWLGLAKRGSGAVLYGIAGRRVC